MNLKSQTRYAQTVRFLNDSLRLNLYLFSPYDILSKTGNLLLFRCTRNNSLDIYVLEGRRNKKVVAHSSGLQKLENSNLKILKFEARFAYVVKFWTDFFRLNFTQFFPDDSFSYDLFCLFQCTINETWQSAFVSQKYSAAGHLRFTGTGKVENQFARISRLRK